MVTIAASSCVKPSLRSAFSPSAWASLTLKRTVASLSMSSSLSVIQYSPLLRFDSRRFQVPGPLGQVALRKRGELFGRRAEHVEAETLQLRFHSGLPQSARNVCVQFAHDDVRRLRGYEYAVAVVSLVARQASFRNARHLRNDGQSTRRRDPERAQAPRPYLRHERVGRGKYEMHLPRDDCGSRIVRS